jgi:hypothetical protein
MFIVCKRLKALGVKFGLLDFDALTEEEQNAILTVCKCDYDYSEYEEFAKKYLNI